MGLHFMRPEWLWLIPAAALVALLLWLQRERNGSWHTVIAPQLLPYLVGENSGTRSMNYLPLIFVGWLLAAFAASGPSWQKIAQPIHQKQDALVLLLDLSYSMKSTDLAPSRLDRARQKLLDLLQQRREGQTGLIAYAGDAHIVTPLTDDIATISNLLPALHPDMMPVPGSDPVSAVTQGIDLLRSAGIRQGRLLLLTDGITEQDRKAIERVISASGVSLGIMGVGTKEGAPIPLPRGGFLKDRQGAIVVPGLNEQTLRELASTGNSRYMRIQITDRDIDYLLADKLLTSSEQTLVLERTTDTWEDQGYYLLPPLLLLVLALFRRGWLLGLAPWLLVPMLFGNAAPASAQNWDNLWQTPDQQGWSALQQGDAEAAAGLFESPDWAGIASYRSGDFESAEQFFAAEKNADNLYNKGNALARAGKLEESMEAYRESLQLDPDREDAQHNLALVEDLLKQQQEQQEQQPQDGEGDGEQQDSDNQEQQASDGEQQEQQQDADSQQQDQQQEQQSPSAGDQQTEPQSGQQQGMSEQEREENEKRAQQARDETGESDAESAQAQAQAKPANPEELERDQAMEQWLRRVPDDPSGLLREKFRYESQLRQQQGTSRDDEIYW